jgi:hypothetical protein
MAVLSAQDRQRISTGLQRSTAVFGGVPNVLKSDLLAAVNATDDWIDTNSAAFNTALPTLFRNNASLAQKTILFCAVALARVSLAFLKQMFGEVD